jgi:predicted Rdx family selenoprotein
MAFRMDLPPSSSQRGIIWKIDQNGKKIWNRSADLSGVENYFNKDTGDFDIITQNGTIWRMSPDGNIINATLINQTPKISPQDRRSATGCKDSMCWYQTDDSGFIYVESIQETRDNIHNLWTCFHAVKTNSDGIIVWNKNITSFKKEMGFGNAGLKKIIQTKDGGYLLAFENEEVRSC